MYVIGAVQDISERKRLEEEVRFATARLELALRGSNIGIWDIDMPDGDLANGRIYYVNVWEQLGYERPDSPNDQETGMALVHPDDRVPHAEAARRYLAGETGEFEVESRVCHKDGSYRWMISRGVAVRDAGGKPIRFLGSGIDITDRKRAEEALRQANARLDLAVRGSNIGHLGMRHARRPHRKQPSDTDQRVGIAGLRCTDVAHRLSLDVRALVSSGRPTARDERASRAIRRRWGGL